MKWRILLLSMGMTLVCMLVFAFAGARVYYQSSIDDSREFLSVYMNAFDADRYSLDESGAVAFSQTLGGARVTFMDTQGNVIGDSAASDLGNHLDRDEVHDAAVSGEGFAVRSSTTLGKSMVYFCKNFSGEYMVRIAIFTDSDWQIFASTLPTLAVYYAIIALLCVFVTFAATHFIISPVKSLARDAAANPSVKTKYPELVPVAEILNERNRNIQSRMDELKEEKELVDRAQKSKDEFISNVTHEMNTPLTSIKGYAELLDAGVMSEDQKSVAYKTILTQSERMTNLIACIINYSELDSDDLPPYEVDFTALARETLHALQPAADKKKVRIITELDENVKVLSRHERISELFGNLVRNAIKYNKDGGSVTVSLNFQRLVVEDTGIGIAAENLDKVFSRFFTVDKSHNGKNGGFGLGLAVVKKICQKSGWKISVQSTLGIGSKFTVEF